MAGVLYLVATPIGHPDDITLRAVGILRAVDVVVCEELREGDRLLRHLRISVPVETLNEHNEMDGADAILRHLIAGLSVALVSDCGTPVFSDPGRNLVRTAIEHGIRIVPIPGPSSLMPALIVSGFPIDRFLFYGWLSPKKEERRDELRRLTAEKHTIVLMDTPYRLTALLRDLADVFGDSRKVCVAYNLTMQDEEIFRGTASELDRQFASQPKKGEFVILIDASAGIPTRRTKPVRSGKR